MNELEKAIEEIYDEFLYPDGCGRLKAWQLICDKARIGDMLENMSIGASIGHVYREHTRETADRWCTYNPWNNAKEDWGLEQLKEALESLKPKEPELLPCPMCGKEAVIGGLSTDQPPPNYWTYSVYCLSNCISTGYRPTKEEAIRIWNTRK